MTQTFLEKCGPWPVFVSYTLAFNNNNNNNNLLQLGCYPVAVGYFTCKQNMKLVTTKFKSEGLHEKHVVATCLTTEEKAWKKPQSG